MAQYGSGVVLTAGLLGGSDTDSVDVYLFAGEAHSFWIAGADTAGAGYLADPRLTLAGYPGDPNTAATAAIVAEDNAEGSNAVINFTAPVTGWYVLTVGAAGGGGLYDLVDTNRSFEGDILDHIGPGTPGTDFVLAVNDSLKASLELPADTDVAAVTLIAGTAYSIDLRGADSGTLADPLLSLLDDNGAVLARADNGGAGRDAHLDFTPASTGTYFLRAASVTPTAYGNYELAVSDGAGSIDGVPGTAATPFSAVVGGSVHGTINGAGDADWYVLSLAGGFQYQFQLQPGGLSHPLLELRDAGGAVVGSDDDGGTGGSAVMDLTPSQSGLYYLVARDVGSGTGAFDLSARMLDPQPDAIVVVGADPATPHGATIVGSETNDVLFGSNLADRIDGGNGNDWIESGPGNDTLFGGSDHDHVDGGAGIDTFDGATYVSLANTSYQYIGGISWEQLVSIENVIGTSGADVLTGNAGANALSGGAGYDVLTGGGGKDLLTGGGGLDRMVYKSLYDSGTSFATRDVVNTFAHGDKIDLSAIDANFRVAGNQAFTFTNLSHFTHVAGQLIWAQTAPAGWLVQGDVNGDGAADFSVQIYASTAFGHPYSWDFVL